MKGRNIWPLLIAGLFVVLAVFVQQQGFALVLNQYENIAFRLDPSAARAFTYGERHFNAQNIGAYDIERAAHFFAEAERLDPEYHYLNHQLARIAFLRGDFPRAMSYINSQIALEGTSTPNSYYIRGLIEGYAGDYDAAARDYEKYLSLLQTPNWAGFTDYAWVLLKAGRHADAARLTDEALGLFPDNPWLLNSNAIAYFELGEYERALVSARKAAETVNNVSTEQWLTAYPGNDPNSASAGLTSFRTAVEDNMHRIEASIASSTVQ